MKKHLLILTVALSLVWMAASSLSLAQDSSSVVGEIKLSYSFFDQEGKRSTTEDVFNLYSGLALGSLNFNSYFANGTWLKFSSSNLNRGSRDLSLSLRRTNWLDFRLFHQESRFLFGQNQENSKRKNSGGSFWVSPLKWLKFFGDYNYQKKEGNRIGLLPNQPGLLGNSFDQSLQNGKLGLQLNGKRNFFSYSFRILDFDSRISEAFDRRSNRHQLVYNTSLPRNLFLSFQYLRDDAKLTESDLEMDTDLYTLSLLYKILKGLSLSGRFYYQSTDNQATALTSKTLKNGYNLVYDVNRRIGFEAGYEYERRKNEDGQNNLNSFLIGARSLPLDNLKLKASYLRKERKDKDLSTLVGPYDSDNLLFNLNYKPIKQLVVDLKYQDRQRDNDEILTSTDSKGFISFASFTYNDRFSADATFSLQDVEYQDTFGRFFDKTRQFSVNGTLKPVQSLIFTGGFAYFRAKGDLDLEKEDLRASVEYVIWKELSAEFRYNQYNYDDYLIATDFYTLNLFTLTLTQKFGSQ
jgi:hypothetical protein